MAFLKSHGAAFGLRNAEAELQAADEALDQQGGAHLTYQQVYAGVPVFGAVVKGIDLVEKIGQTQTDRQDRPVTPVTMNKVTIERT